tara:strand:- start:2893 stop:3090 length:198 start_codon:yes stop_codon:yes gene_type:complete
MQKLARSKAMQVARRLSTVIIWIVALFLIIDAMGFIKDQITTALIALALTYAVNWVFADKNSDNE